MSAATSLHILRLMQRDPRLAYLLGPGSQSFDMLIEDAANAQMRDAATVRAEFTANLKTEPWPSEYDIQCRIEDAVAHVCGLTPSKPALPPAALAAAPAFGAGLDDRSLEQPSEVL